MGWKEQLLGASFRGVPFLFEGAARKGGRRYEIHELPQRDLPEPEDLGQLPQVFTFDAYVLGDDFLEQKAKLTAACMEPGDGRGGSLVHPYLGGVIHCVCTKFEVRWNNGDGRMARFVLEFTRTTDVVQRIQHSSPQGAIEDAGTDAEAAAEASVALTLEVEGVPEVVREGGMTSLQQLSAKMKSLDVFSGPAAKAAEFARQVEDLASNAASLIKAPADLAFELRATVVNMAASVRSSVSSLAAYEILLNLGTPNLFGGSSLVDQARDRNAKRVNHLGRVVAASGAAQAAVDVSWESHDEAVARRDGLVASIDALLDDADAATYTALVQLQATMVEVIPDPDQTLARLETITLARTQPAVVLAFNLYGDPTRAREIARRNKIPHPGLVPGGRPLQVLVDA